MDTRSPPKSDKSFWILLVAVIVIVIILIVVSLKCNKPCKDKSCKGTCIEEKPCSFDKDCPNRGERCVGPKSQNFTPPGNCMLSNAQCKTNADCLPNMYCDKELCTSKQLCKYEAKQLTDPCTSPNECNVAVVPSLLSISSTTASGSSGSGTGTWILKGATQNSRPASGTYSVAKGKNLITFLIKVNGSGFTLNDIASQTGTPFLPVGFSMTADNKPGFSAPTWGSIDKLPVFTLSKPSQNARGYCEPPTSPAQINSQSHTLRGASHSSY